jgi:hypothetical protein
MKPIPDKKLSQNTNCHSERSAMCHSEPKAKNLKPSHASDSSSRCIGVQNDNFQTFSNNSRPGVAILVVLFVIMAATVISLGFIARSDVELAFGRNTVLRMQMDYLAESGLTHAKALITNPQDAETDPNVFWAGQEDLSLKDLDLYDMVEEGDYYDLVVTRDDSNPTDRCTYDISSRAYRLNGAEKIAQSYLNARLRLDPCIAYWAGAGTTVSIAITVNGDVYCSGSLTNSGTINGDVHALGLTGAVSGRLYDIGASPLDVTWPNLNIGDFAPAYDSDAYTPQIVDANTVLAGNISYVSLPNPAGVIVCDGNLTLDGVSIEEGTLIVNGDLTVQGIGNTVTSAKNFPALVVNGQLNLVNGPLTVTGLVQVNTMSVSAAASNATITGALFVRDSGINVDGGYTGNITITAAPMMASLKLSADKWTPIGGAFFKWIERE